MRVQSLLVSRRGVLLEFRGQCEEAFAHRTGRGGGLPEFFGDNSETAADIVGFFAGAIDQTEPEGAGFVVQPVEFHLSHVASVPTGLTSRRCTFSVCLSVRYFPDGAFRKGFANPHFSHSLRPSLLLRRARCQKEAEKRIGQYG